MSSKGRPKKQVELLPPDKLKKFIQKVYQGESITMLKWEFKLSAENIKKLCKENNLILNTGDILVFSNRLSKYHKC